MKKIKDIILVLAIILGTFTLTACGKKNETVKNVEGNLTDIMDKLYTNISDDEKPMMLKTTELTEETFENYAFIKDVDYTSAVVSESGVGSIAHSVVLIRLKDASDAEKVVGDLKENANPRKWICVEAENVIVKSKGDLVVLIMANELAETISTNFDNL